MDIFLWIVIILLFIISFIGVFIPIVPAVIAIWASFLIYHFFINGEKLSLLFWLIMGSFSLLLIVADFLMSRYFVYRYGGSKWSELGAIVGIIVGMFIIPPFGIIVVPFIVVLCIELIHRATFQKATYVALGSLLGFISSTFAKMLIQTIMIIVFFLFLIFK